MFTIVSLLLAAACLVQGSAELLGHPLDRPVIGSQLLSQLADQTDRLILLSLAVTPGRRVPR